MMKITNKTGLPEFFVDKVKGVNNAYDLRKRAENVISVTELLNDPKYFWLKRRHDSEAEQDVQAIYYSIQGTLFHALMEGGTGDAIDEERLQLPVGDYIVSGKFDRYDGDLWDYKYTSVWSVIMGDKVKDWTKQANVYALLLERAGFKVVDMHVIAAFRDWKIREVMNGKYELFPYEKIKLEKLSECDIMEWIEGRVTELMSYKDTPDDMIPECTPKGRWQRETKYAVMKRGNKRATALFDTYTEAGEYARLKGTGFSVETRQGEDVRCSDMICTIKGVTLDFGHCPYRKWCNFYQRRRNEFL